MILIVRLYMVLYVSDNMIKILNYLMNEIVKMDFGMFIIIFYVLMIFIVIGREK